METILTIMVWLATVAVFMYYRHRYGRSGSSSNGPQIREKENRTPGIRFRV